MKNKFLSRKWAALLLLGLALLSLPATTKADPLNLQPLTLTNLPPITNTTPVTNINSTFTIVPNSQTSVALTFQTFGTNNAAGLLALGFNFTQDGTNWTTDYPWTNNCTLTSSNLTHVWFVNWTNWTTFKQGRLDSLQCTGTTNGTLNAATVSQKTIAPY